MNNYALSYVLLLSFCSARFRIDRSLPHLLMENSCPILLQNPAYFSSYHTALFLKISPLLFHTSSVPYSHKETQRNSIKKAQRMTVLTLILPHRTPSLCRRFRVWPADCSNESRINTDGHYNTFVQVKYARPRPDGHLGSLFRPV